MGRPGGVGWAKTKMKLRPRASPPAQPPPHCCPWVGGAARRSGETAVEGVAANSPSKAQLPGGGVPWLLVWETEWKGRNKWRDKLGTGIIRASGGPCGTAAHAVSGADALHRGVSH